MFRAGRAGNDPLLQGLQFCSGDLGLVLRGHLRLGLTFHATNEKRCAGITGFDGIAMIFTAFS